MQYNSVAEKYSECFLEYNRDSVEAYFRYFNMNLKKKKVLDLGCGSGYDLSRVKAKGALIYGIDGSKEMVKIARQNNPDGVIEVGHFDEIPFADNSFDLVISKWALQTASLIDPIYEEIVRILKRKGKMIILACHPIRQFIEKKKQPKDYFKKEIVKSVFFDGQITALEPSHTMNEYLSPFFFNHFILEAFEEGFDLAAEKVEGDIYPSYFIIKASLKTVIS